MGPEDVVVGPAEVLEDVAARPLEPEVAVLEVAGLEREADGLFEVVELL